MSNRKIKILCGRVSAKFKKQTLSLPSGKKARLNMLLNRCHTSLFLPIISAAAVSSSLGLTVAPDVILSSLTNLIQFCTLQATLAFTNHLLHLVPVLLPPTVC